VSSSSFSRSKKIKSLIHPSGVFFRVKHVKVRTDSKLLFFQRRCGGIKYSKCNVIARLSEMILLGTGRADFTRNFFKNTPNL
jgi:hypothetical protein